MKTINTIFMSSKLHPLFFITLSFVCGIALQKRPYAFTINATIATACIALALFGFSKKINNMKMPLIFLLIFLLGALRYTQKINEQKTFYQKTANKIIDAIATVKDIHKKEGKMRNICITAHMEQIKLDEKEQWKPIHKAIQIYTKKNHDIKIEDKIKIKNLKIKGPKNEHFAFYLIKQNIAATIFTPNIEHELIARPKWSASRWLTIKRKKIAQNVKRKMPIKLFSMFSSMFLGNRNIPQRYNHEIKNKFKSLGIMHFLARSGLHLIIFLLLCTLMLQFFPFYFYIKQIIIILLSSIYLLLSWPSTSFIRAFSILLFYKLLPFFNKKPDIVHIVTTVCLLMLLHNPILLFFLDFQLSFGLTFSLAFFSQIQIQRNRKAKLIIKKNQKKSFSI